MTCMLKDVKFHKDVGHEALYMASIQNPGTCTQWEDTLLDEEQQETKHNWYL